MGNTDLRETKQIMYPSKGIDESYPKMYFLLILSHYVKSCGHFCQILEFFMMPAHQIWPCHVTQEANFETFLRFPNSALNIRTSYKISSRKALYFRSYQPKTSQGWKTPPPPVLLGLRHNRDVSRSGRCPNAFVHYKREESHLFRSLNSDKKLS